MDNRTFAAITFTPPSLRAPIFYATQELPLIDTSIGRTPPLSVKQTMKEGSTLPLSDLSR